MDTNIYKILNLEATLADLMAATEDEFSAILSKIKAEYRKLHGIKAKKKSLKPFKVVNQKARKLYAHYIELGMHGFSDLNHLMGTVFKLNAVEFEKIGYTLDQYKLDFANEVATVMASTIFQKSYEASSHSGVLRKLIKECEEIDSGVDLAELFERRLNKVNIASWAVFQGTVYTKSPLTGKKVGRCYAKVCMTEGFEKILTDDILNFTTFDEIGDLLSQCAVVAQIMQQSVLLKNKTVDVEALFKVSSSKGGSKTTKKVEKTTENEVIE